MKPKKYMILKNCATTRQTYFGGEIVLVPSEVDPDLIKTWISEGVAEPIEPEEPVENKASPAKESSNG